MGMYGEWFRLTPEELLRARSDPAWAFGYAEEVAGKEDDDGGVAGRRSSGADKTWQALDVLLRRHDFPVSIVHGEESLFDDPEDPDADWGYGPPGYLTPEQVKQAAAALSVLTEEQLLVD